MNNKKGYLSNPNLKKIGENISLTREQELEYELCMENPIYFIEKYVTIVSIDKGKIKMELFDKQKDIVRTYHKERKVVLTAARQIGKTTTTVAYFLWFILFNVDKTSAILANKAATAREILARIKLAYELLPKWLQQGVKTWNKGSIELENGCGVLTASTSSSAIRGFSIACLFLDEFAFVHNNVAEEFFTSVYPTISSGKESKIFIASTPNGMNHFYKIWHDSQNREDKGWNGFVPVKADWRTVPGRDEAWAEDQLRTLGEQKFRQEVECEFMGSSGTLISGKTLAALTYETPISHDIYPDLKMLSPAIPGHRYVITVDSTRGSGIDYSAFIVVDVSQLPMKTVAIYKSNSIPPLAYSDIIAKVSRHYNQAYVLVENNDIGAQVVDDLHHTHELENLLKTIKDEGKLKFRVANEYESKNSQRGIRTTTSVKRIGCSILKDLIENHQLQVPFFEIIQELSVFSLKKDSFQAEEGHHDDLAMCLVLLAWLTKDRYFQEEISANIGKVQLYGNHVEAIMNDQILPPSQNDIYKEDFLDEQKYILEDGSVWTIVN